MVKDLKLREKITSKKWYNGAVIACIGVAFYVLLTHLGLVLSTLGNFLGIFRSVLIACIFAYVINPVAKFFYYRVFRFMKLGRTRWTLSVVLAFLAGLLVLGFLIGTLIPQLVQSIRLFTENFEDYLSALVTWINNTPVPSMVNTEQLQTLFESTISNLQGFVRENAGTILNSAANSGRSLVSTAIALILAIYLLLDKKRVLRGVRRFFRAMFRPETNENMLDFLLRCDVIVISYLGQALLDSLIVGLANAVFMLVCRMQYIGLVSVVVAVTNLIPSFGPAIGAVIGGFILVMVNPLHALIFLIFTVVLQSVDAYILKPKLFSNSLGVSGLLILVSTIVFGNLFGVWGVLLAIPAAAILSFVYNDILLPKREQLWERASDPAETQDTE